MEPKLAIHHSPEEGIVVGGTIRRVDEPLP